MLFDPLAPVVLPEAEGAEVLVTIGPEGTSLDLLRAVYRDPGQPLTRRMRAAIAAAPYENPKLAVVASMRANDGFAAKLEEAIARSRQVRARKAEP